MNYMQAQGRSAAGIKQIISNFIGFKNISNIELKSDRIIYWLKDGSFKEIRIV